MVCAHRRRSSSGGRSGGLKRYDFGISFKPTFCSISQCGKLTRNRGCALCQQQVFCKGCYQVHCHATHCEKLHELSEVFQKRSSRNFDMLELIWRWKDAGFWWKEAVDLNPAHWSKPLTKFALALDLKHNEQKEQKNQQRPLYVQAAGNANFEKEFASPREAILWAECGCDFSAEASDAEDDVQDQRILLSQSVTSLKQEAINQFSACLDSIPGKKILDCCDKTVVLLDHLGVDKSLLLARNVDIGKTIEDFGDQMVFVMRCPDAATLKAKFDAIGQNQNRDRRYTVVFIPAMSGQCKEFLRTCSVKVNTKELPLHLIPFDDDVLSMEIPGVFSDFRLRGDVSFAHYTAQAMLELQQTFGVINRVHSIGEAGQIAKRMLRTTSWSRPHEDREDGVSEVIFIDRGVDVYSVLSQQYTYEALIDESLGLKANIVKTSKLRMDIPSAIPFYPRIPFYREVRHLHFDKVVRLILHSVSKLEAIYDKSERIAMTIEDITPDMQSLVMELKDFAPIVREAIKDKKRMGSNIKLCEYVQSVMKAEDYQSQLKLESDILAGGSQTALTVIKQRIQDQRPFHEVLRWLCLYCLVEGSNAPELADIKQSVLSCYNNEYLDTFCNAQQAGIMRSHEQRPSWSRMKEKYSLIVEGSDIDKDISYAYGGYAPLSVRLVEKKRKQQSEWHVDESLSCKPDDPSAQFSEPKQNVFDSASSDSSTVVVCFLGGVTYGEIAALRRLSEKEKNRRKFLIVTTELLNSKKFFEHLGLAPS